MRVIGGKLRSFSIGYIERREGRSLPREFTRPEAVTLSREERERLPDGKGILPVTASKDFVRPDDYRYGFLAGNGEVLKGCGVWMWRGCLEHDKHSPNIREGQRTIRGGIASKIDVVEAYKASCGRLACPVCYEKACGKEAVKIEHRMMSFKLKGRKLKAIHVSVSPSEKDVITLTFPELRRKAYQMAMKCGVFGGSLIFHPFRRYNEDDLKEDLEAGFDWKEAPACWYISPHFHIIGYGWVHHVKENYEISAWIVKNHGVRKSVRSTAHYQLSHCGVHGRFHTIIWFGALAYNKMRAPKLLPEKHPCPLCSGEMRKVAFVDEEYGHIVESTLEDEGIYYVGAGLFRYVKEISRLGDGGGQEKSSYKLW